MSLTVWNKQSGLLATIQEGNAINIQLPANHHSNIHYAIISGKLPPGTWIDKNYIKGTPYEVSRETTFSFCIRASQQNYGISDRTFSLIVNGADAPVIVTPTGLLDIGPKKQLYVIDNTFVNYQIRAIDSDTSTGQKLTYYIDPAYGILPPGLSLTKDGIIYGVVDAVTSLTPNDGTGAYDNGLFDVAPYDFANIQQQNGFDVYPYDKPGYDFTITLKPKKLNRHYRFRVFVTDSETATPPSREFEIFVVTDSFFRADADALISDLKPFTADVTYLSQPIWITQSNLGIYRANNYITLMLDVYDTGLIYYTLGNTTTRWAANTVYLVDDLIYETPKISYICRVAHTSGSSLNLANWARYGLPPGMEFDDKTGEVFGKVPAQPAVTTTYTFSVTATRHGDEDTTEIAKTLKTFTVSIIGEIESAISWVTPSELGTIDAGYASSLFVRANSSYYNAVVTHTIIDGNLPPGLSLMSDGEIVGVISQFSTSIAFDRNTTTFTSTTFDQTNKTYGLTTFSNNYASKTRTTFDNNTTSFNRKFTFTVKASDQSYYSATERTFTITVKTPNLIPYSNIRVQPFLSPNHVTLWKTFITSNVFNIDNIYRPYDPAFGIQDNLSMLIFEGIETRSYGSYILGFNHKTKHFRFGNIKKAAAILPGTKTALYEVVYIEMIETTLSNSVEEWRYEFSLISQPKYNFLPLWMRSVQPTYRKELGFILAVPICFCKVGTADNIMLKIKYSDFDFKLIDYQIDRFIINAVTGSHTDKYIIFDNKETQ